VLGCGVDVPYPRQNEKLMEQISHHGCVLSQYPMGTKPVRGNFPYRNRIISGISLGTLIVEAPIRSGALITARQAAEQGREVFAIPGPIGSAASEGPHALIRDGAKLVETVEDILIELDLPSEFRVAPTRLRRPETEPAQSAPTQTLAAPTQTYAEPATRGGEPQRAARRDTPSPPKAAPTPPSQPSPSSQPASPAPAAAAVQTPSETERRVLDVLQADGAHVDEIATASRLSIAEALSSLTMLELKGLVRQFSGKRFALR
jgi:DNA processing protein